MGQPGRNDTARIARNRVDREVRGWSAPCSCPRRHLGPLPSPRTDGSGPLLVLVSVASLATLALTDVGRASPRALVSARPHGVTLDAMHSTDLLAVRAGTDDGEDAGRAVDGREDTYWMGRAGEQAWRWSATFARPIQLGLVRARLGLTPMSGVPTVFRWEALRPAPGSTSCRTDAGAELWTLLDAPTRADAVTDPLARPTRRSFFADVDACELRLTVDRTNAGPPVLREVQTFESARDVLRDATASDDGAFPRFDAAGVVDGTYAGRWAGAPERSRWTLRLDLREATPIDRIRLVLGFDATSVPRPGHGRSYAVAWSPLHYVLEGSEDGVRFFALAGEPQRPDGTVLPLRRRLLTFPGGRRLRALRLVMAGATGASGQPDASAVPVVREISAFRADDPRPILAPPWVLSVNANPSAQTHGLPGGEAANDAYWAKFLQHRFSLVLPEMERDDRYDRSLGARGEPLDAVPRAEAGEVLESIEGDDPVLDASWLSRSSPPPITVLSGSGDWDYAGRTGPDPQRPRHWLWDPLPPPGAGGMGQVAAAVRGRVAPFLGFCGGAQLLALFEAQQIEGTPDDDLQTIDSVLRRTSGPPVRGFAPGSDTVRSWPGDASGARTQLRFDGGSPLFADLFQPDARTTSRAFSESHSDAIRPDAFLPGGPLERLALLASSDFCGPRVVTSSARDVARPAPSGGGLCATIPEVFRSRDPAWPLIGTQFHPEQRDFASPAPGDPPESVADARLFFAATYEELVDAYLRLAP